MKRKTTRYMWATNQIEWGTGRFGDQGFAAERSLSFCSALCLINSRR
jgi:hypothetical protein